MSNAYVLRFSLSQRVEHFVTMVVFTLLCLTGLPQKFFDSGRAASMVSFFGGIDSTRWIHRICGIALALSTVVHFANAIHGMLSKRIGFTMVPTRKDFEDAIRCLDLHRQVGNNYIVTVQDPASILRPMLEPRQRVQVMIQPAAGMDCLGGEMRRYTFHYHVAAEDHILQTNGNMTRTMPRQVEELERANSHPRGFIGYVHRDGLVECLSETMHVHEEGALFLLETGPGQKESQPAAAESEPALMVSHVLQVQLMYTDLCPGDGPETRKAAKVIDMGVRNENMSEIEDLYPRFLHSVEKILMGFVGA